MASTAVNAIVSMAEATRSLLGKKFVSGILVVQPCTRKHIRTIFYKVVAACAALAVAREEDIRHIVETEVCVLHGKLVIYYINRALRPGDWLLACNERTTPMFKNPFQTGSCHREMMLVGEGKKGSIKRIGGRE